MLVPWEAYEIWLAIPRAECPPHHYALLGLPPGEGDPHRVESAAADRRQRLAPHLHGPAAEAAAALLDMVEQARRTLLQPAAKRLYDEQLALRFGPPVPPAPPVVGTFSAGANFAPPSLAPPSLAPPSLAPPSLAPPAGFIAPAGLSPPSLAPPPPDYAPSLAPPRAVDDPPFAPAADGPFRRESRGGVVAMLLIGVPAATVLIGLAVRNGGGVGPQAVAVAPEIASRRTSPAGTRPAATDTVAPTSSSTSSPGSSTSSPGSATSSAATSGTDRPAAPVVPRRDSRNRPSGFLPMPDPADIRPAPPAGTAPSSPPTDGGFAPPGSAVNLPPRVDGIFRPKFETDFAQSPLAGTDLLALVRPDKDTLLGPAWERLPLGLAAPGTLSPPPAGTGPGPRVVRVPYRLPDEYVLRVRLSRSAESGTVRIVLPDARGEGGLALGIDSAGTILLEMPATSGARIARSGLDGTETEPLVQRLDALTARLTLRFPLVAPTRLRPPFPIGGGGGLVASSVPERKVIEPGKPQLLTLSVRRESLRLEADGVELFDQPVGTHAFVLPPALRGSAAPGELALAADGPALFHQVRVEASAVGIREAVPAGKEVQDAKNRIRTYVSRYATLRTPKDKLAVFEQFRRELPGSFDSAGKFVTLSTLRDWACELGRAQVALQCTGELVRRYELPGPLERAVTLRRLVERPGAADATDLPAAAVVGFAESMIEEEYEAADEYLRALKRCVERAGIGYARPLIERQTARLESFRASFARTRDARETLRTAPDDPAACLALGLHYALTREEWQNARPYLERCGVAEWEEIARLERAAAAPTSTGGPALAERLDALVVTVPSDRREAVIRRASHWRLAALPRLSEAEMIPLEAKLREAGILALTPAQSLDVVRFQSKAFLFVPQDLAWRDADRWARTRGGHLASIGTATEAGFVKWYVTMYAGRANFWVGGQPAPRLGEWAWTDGTPFAFTDWADKSPPLSGEADRLALYGSGRSEFRWTPQPAGLRFPFLVQWPATD